MTQIYDEAWAEAVASCPTDVRVWPAIEFQHPEFRDEDGAAMPLRFTVDVVDRTFGIEDGALYTPGQMATFLACAFEAEYPEVAEGRVPASRIAVDNVSRQLTPHLNAAVLVRADLVMVYREYREDDLSEPCYGPVRFVMTEVTVSGTRVEGTASLKDLTNTKFPRRTYTRKLFPALVSTT